jgi:hypothetical protein
MTSKQILNNAVNTTANTAQDLFTAGTSAVVIESC